MGKFEPVNLQVPTKIKKFEPVNLQVQTKIFFCLECLENDGGEEWRGEDEEEKEDEDEDEEEEG